MEVLKMARKPSGGQPVPELIRQYSLALLLLRERRNGITRAEIMEELEEHYLDLKDRKTLEVGKDKAEIVRINAKRRKKFQRDCDELEELGIKITGEKGGLGEHRYSIKPDNFSLPDEEFGVLRKMQLELALDSMGDLGGPLFAEDLDSVRVKLGLLKAADEGKPVQPLKPVYIETPAGKSSRIVDELFDRTREKHPISIYYRGAKDRSHRLRKVQPVGMIYRWGDWHLVAYDLNKKDYRLFRAENLKQNKQDINVLKTTPAVALPGADKAVRDYLEMKPWDMGAGKEIAVRVRFSKAVAGPASLALGDDVKFKAPKGGKVEGTIKAKNLENLCGWLMRFGPEAEVLSPPRARQIMGDKARSILAAAGKKGGGRKR